MQALKNHGAVLRSEPLAGLDEHGALDFQWKPRSKSLKSADELDSDVPRYIMPDHRRTSLPSILDATPYHRRFGLSGRDSPRAPAVVAESDQAGQTSPPVAAVSDQAGKTFPPRSHASPRSRSLKEAGEIDCDDPEYLLPEPRRTSLPSSLNAMPYRRRSALSGCDSPRAPDLAAGPDGSLIVPRHGRRSKIRRAEDACQLDTGVCSSGPSSPETSPNQEASYVEMALAYFSPEEIAQSPQPDLLLYEPSCYAKPADAKSIRRMPHRRVALSGVDSPRAPEANKLSVPADYISDFYDPLSREHSPEDFTCAIGEVRQNPYTCAIQEAVQQRRDHMRETLLCPETQSQNLDVDS